MNKAAVLVVINRMLVIVFAVQVITGIGHGHIPYALFESVHKTNGYLLIIVACAHIALNGEWLRRHLLPRRK